MSFTNLTTSNPTLNTTTANRNSPSPHNPTNTNTSPNTININNNIIINSTTAGFFLGLDLSLSHLRAIIVSDTLDVVKAESVDFDVELGEYGTHGGVFTTPGESYMAPVEMWVKAIDLLFEKLHSTFDLSQIRAISGCAHHALIPLRTGALSTLSRLNPALPLHPQLCPPPLHPNQQTPNPQNIFPHPHIPTHLDTSAHAQTLHILSSLTPPGPLTFLSLTGTPAHASLPASHLLKLRSTHPEVWARTGRITSVGSMVAGLLSAEGGWIPMGEADAVESGMWNHCGGRWEGGVLRGVVGGASGTSFNSFNSFNSSSGNINNININMNNGLSNTNPNTNPNTNTNAINASINAEAARLELMLGDVDHAGYGGRKAGTVGSYWVERYGFGRDTILTPFTTSSLLAHLSMLPRAAPVSVGVAVPSPLLANMKTGFNQHANATYIGSGSGASGKRASGHGFYSLSGTPPPAAYASQHQTQTTTTTTTTSASTTPTQTQTFDLTLHLGAVDEAMMPLPAGVGYASLVPQMVVPPPVPPPPMVPQIGMNMGAMGAMGAMGTMGTMGAMGIAGMAGMVPGMMTPGMMTPGSQAQIQSQGGYSPASSVSSQSQSQSQQQQQLFPQWTDTAFAPSQSQSQVQSQSQMQWTDTQTYTHTQPQKYDTQMQKNDTDSAPAAPLTPQILHALHASLGLYSVLPHPVQDPAAEKGRRRYVVRVLGRNADVPRALVRDMYTKSWSAFDRLISIVPPGGSIGLDDKLLSFWFLQPDISFSPSLSPFSGHPSFPSTSSSFMHPSFSTSLTLQHPSPSPSSMPITLTPSPLAFNQTKGIFRFENGVKVGEFRDLRANPRTLVESQVMGIRVRVARVRALIGAVGAAVSAAGVGGKETKEGKENINPNAPNALGGGSGSQSKPSSPTPPFQIPLYTPPIDPYVTSYLPSRVLATGATANFSSVVGIVGDVFDAGVFVPSGQVEGAWVERERVGGSVGVGTGSVGGGVVGGVGGGAGVQGVVENATGDTAGDDAAPAKGLANVLSSISKASFSTGNAFAATPIPSNGLYQPQSQSESLNPATRAALGGAWVARYVWARERERERGPGAGNGNVNGEGATFEEETRAILARRWAGAMERAEIARAQQLQQQQQQQQLQMQLAQAQAQAQSQAPNQRSGLSAYKRLSVHLGSSVLVEEDEEEEEYGGNIRTPRGPFDNYNNPSTNVDPFIMRGSPGPSGAGPGPIGSPITSSFNTGFGSGLDGIPRMRTTTGSSTSSSYLSSGGTGSSNMSGYTTPDMSLSMSSMSMGMGSQMDLNGYLGQQQQQGFGTGSSALMNLGKPNANSGFMNPLSLSNQNQSIHSPSPMNISSASTAPPSSATASTTATIPPARPLTPVLPLQTSDAEAQLGLVKVAEPDHDAFMAYASIVPEFCRLEGMLSKGLV